MPDFQRYIGIDYSGAETAESSLKGLRVYQAPPGAPAVEIQPPPSPRKYWTRRGISHWPFDGWNIAPGRSVIAEVYPSLWRQAYPTEGRTGDQQDAYAVAAWLRDADADGRLSKALKPGLTDYEQAMAGVEGWILGLW